MNNYWKTPCSCLHRCSKYSQLIWWWCSSTQAALCTMQLQTVDDVRPHFLTGKWQHNIWDPVSTVCRVPISTSRCKFMFNNTIRFSHHRLHQIKLSNQYRKLLHLSIFISASNNNTNNMLSICHLDPQQTFCFSQNRNGMVLNPATMTISDPWILSSY